MSGARVTLRSCAGSAGGSPRRNGYARCYGVDTDWKPPFGSMQTLERLAATPSGDHSMPRYGGLAARLRGAPRRARRQSEVEPNAAGTARRRGRAVRREATGRDGRERDPRRARARPRAVFCGINPGRVSAAAGAHFANPRNDFWRLLHDAGLTPRLLAPQEQFELLELGYGVTNAAFRTTPGSGDLRRGDFAGSAERLRAARARAAPRAIAFVGKEAYRGAFGERPELGLQERRLGDTLLFVLPSTSPANAAVPYAERLHWFEQLEAWLTAAAAGGRARVVLDPDDRVLLARSSSRAGASLGDAGRRRRARRADEHALRRELAEETGLRRVRARAVRLAARAGLGGPQPALGGQRERSTSSACRRSRRPAPRAELAAEGVFEQRWWRWRSWRRARALRARAAAGARRRDVRDGPPPAPIAVG